MTEKVLNTNKKKSVVFEALYYRFLDLDGDYFV